MAGDAEMLRGVAASLAQLPDVAIHVVDSELAVARNSIDAVAHGEVKGQPVLFLIECESRGDPRTMQRALEQVRAYGAACPSPTAPLIAAPAISELSREMLRRHRVGYWDSGGSLYVDLPWALYWIDRPVPPAAARILRNAYRGSAAKVLHALLLEPGKVWHISTLAERAEVSVSTVHQVCTFLEDQLWMNKSGTGPHTTRTLSEPGALLDAWAHVHSLAVYSPRRFHRWARNPALMHEAVIDALDSASLDYALTLSSGANLVAPHSTDTDHVWLLMPVAQAARLVDLARAANLHEVDDGESVTIFLTRERAPLLFRRKLGRSWVASDVQLYLDLSAWPRRGKEQAQHLRTERMKY